MTCWQQEPSPQLSAVTSKMWWESTRSSCPASEKHLGCEASLMLLLDIWGLYQKCHFLSFAGKALTCLQMIAAITIPGMQSGSNLEIMWRPTVAIRCEGRLYPVIKRGNGNPLCMIWLVVYLPLWKIWKSVGMMKFPKYGKIKNVWNHQPDDYKWSLEWENPLTNGHFICFLHHLDIPKAAKRASGLPASASDSSAWPAVHLPAYM